MGFARLGATKRRSENGASEGIRTLDTHVGNVMLYQAELRSLPEVGTERIGEPAGLASPISGRFAGLAQRCADNLEQIIVVYGLVEKRHRAAGGCAFLAF